MVLFKKALSLYQQTAALLVVLVVLTASIFYVVIGPVTQPINSAVSEINISYPCPGDPRCEPDTASGEIASIFQAGGNCSVSESEIAITQNEKQIFNLINDYRRQNGLSELTLSEGLSRAAAWLSHDMAERDVLSHADSLGRSPGQRVGDCGYSAYKSENIAMNTSADPSATFTGWQNSPGHNAAMLMSDARAIGVAEWRVSGRSYWTTDFGVTSDGSWDGGNLTPSPTRSSNLNFPILKLNLILPGIGNGPFDNKSPIANYHNGGTQRNSYARFYDISDNLILEQTGSVWYNPSTGSFEGRTDLISQDTPVGSAKYVGTYIVKVKIENSLWKNLGLLQFDLSKETDSNKVLLVTGDVNQDNSLNLSDYNILISCYGAGSCDQKSSADLNLDGAVDEKDLNIFYTGLAKRQGD